MYLITSNLTPFFLFFFMLHYWVIDVQALPLIAGHCRNPQTESLLEFLELPYLLDAAVGANTPIQNKHTVDSRGILLTHRCLKYCAFSLPFLFSSIVLEHLILTIIVFLLAYESSPCPQTLYSLFMNSFNITVFFFVIWWSRIWVTKIFFCNPW